jgi:hypothetical protein
MAHRYAFSDGVVAINLKGADPQVVGEALERIRLEHGGELHAYHTWNDAKDITHPLHRFFQWDVQKAAEAHWLDQARALIRSVRVIDIEEGKPLRAYLSIYDDGRSYRSIDDVLRSRDLRDIVLEQAQRDLDAWTHRFRELQDIVALIEPARRELTRRRAARRDRGAAPPPA